MSARGSRPDDLHGIYRRSLGLQGSWNPERMQNLGLAVALLPWLRRSGAAPAELRRFCRRHLEFFNTNPYCANLLLGGLVRLEAENLRGGATPVRTLTMFKDSLGRALASLGDQFLWLGLQPALMLLAVLSAWPGLVWPPLLVVGLFAATQLLLRRRALLVGYDLGLDIVDLLGSPRWHRAIWTAKRAGALLTGVLAGMTAVSSWSRLGDPGGMTTVLGTALAMAAALFLRRRWPGEGLLLALVPLALLLSCL